MDGLSQRLYDWIDWLNTIKTLFSPVQMDVTRKLTTGTMHVNLGEKFAKKNPSLESGSIRPTCYNIRNREPLT